MATLINPTPLNVAAPVQVSTLTPAVGAPAVVEPRAPQITTSGYITGPNSFMTTTPTTPLPAVADLTPGNVTFANVTQQVK